MKEVKKFYNELLTKKYGWHDKKDKLHRKLSDGNFTKNYKMQSLKKAKERRHVICWEMCELEREFFKKNKIKHKVIFMLSREDNKYYCHTFTAFFMNKNWYHFEASWDNKKGIHKYNSLEEMLDYLKDNFSDFVKKEDYDRNKISFHEYRRPRFVKSCNMFYFHCMHSKKIY